MIETKSKSGKQCHIYRQGRPKAVLYWGIEANGRNTFEKTVQILQQFNCKIPYLLVAYEIENWYRDFSPWAAPAVFGQKSFAGYANQTLEWLTGALIPSIEKTYIKAMPAYQRYIGGYSLSGLFSMWAFYSSRQFQGVANCSGSLWFPSWAGFIANQSTPPNSLAYLSLGKREEQTKNKALSCVGDVMRIQYKALCKDPAILNCTLEYNDGGHFNEPEKRLAKGFIWLLANSIK